MRSCSTTSPSPCPTARSCSTGSASPSARGRIRLIGANGCGKSTLLRLIAGELTPARSSVQVAGSLGYLRQDLTLAADLAVEEVLGSARARRALRAIERAGPPPSTAPPSATTGTSTSAPAPPWTGSAWPTSGWTGASASCPVAGRSPRPDRRRRGRPGPARSRPGWWGPASTSITLGRSGARPWPQRMTSASTNRTRSPKTRCSGTRTASAARVPAATPGQLGERLVVVVPVDQGQLHPGVVAQLGGQAQGDVQPVSCGWCRILGDPQHDLAGQAAALLGLERLAALGQRPHPPHDRP
jgi:energy-coupling factor transporter ATP-binding protein EcfA2